MQRRMQLLARNQVLGRAARGLRTDPQFICEAVNSWRAGATCVRTLMQCVPYAREHPGCPTYIQRDASARQQYPGGVEDAATITLPACCTLLRVLEEREKEEFGLRAYVSTIPGQAIPTDISFLSVAAEEAEWVFPPAVLASGHQVIQR